MPLRPRWRDLAVFGGGPRFEHPLHVNKPNAVDRERLFARIGGALDRRWLSDGVLVREFEEEVARITETRHCVATCNGTLGIEVALAGLQLGGEVVVPSFTFMATAQALRWRGLTPVYCDIDPATHNIDPQDAERRITPRTSAVMGVHLWGHPCDVDALQEVAGRHGLRLLFDAAHALGSRRGERAVGGFGEAEAFSFHATKFISAGEGGAVTTDDDALADRLRSARDVGFDADDRVVGPGTNAKMSELSAALGLTSLEAMDEVLRGNRNTRDHYRRGLRDVAGVDLFDPPAAAQSNQQFVVATVDDSVTGITRDDILRVLHAENVLARRYFHPGCHRQDPLHRPPGGAAGSELPVTEALARSVLVLPGGASVTGDEVDGVCHLLATVAAHGPEVAAALGASSSPVRG